MEIKDIIFLVVIGLGVLALKGVYDAFAALNIPIWMFFILTIVFIMVGAIGILFLLMKQAEKSGDLSKAKFSLPVLRIKYAFRASVHFWLTWPAWVFMLLVGKLLESWSIGWARMLGDYFKVNLESELPILGSPLLIVSVALAGVFLMFISMPFFLFTKGPGGRGIGVCQKCGSMHDRADNYCSNCGAALQRRI
ncbi:MAG: zinc ribbon domain-containing protein [Candidatus Micrarchaeota archaeon]